MWIVAFALASWFYLTNPSDDGTAAPWGAMVLAFIWLVILLTSTPGLV